MKQSNSKTYPEIRYLQNVIICPVNITEVTDKDGNISYNFSRIDLPDNAMNRQKTADQLMQEATIQYLTVIKKQKLNEGFYVNETLFDSDTNARLAYAELRLKISRDPTYTVSWKASEGNWVTMDVALLDQIESAGEEHIANVFAWLQSELNKL